MEGWICIHRCILDDFLWNASTKKTKFEAWMSILILVNHTDNKVLIKSKVYPVKRGQTIRSLDTWARQWGWSKSATKRYLLLLEKEGKITYENIKISIRITVCNYDYYQTHRHASETQLKHNRNTSETQMKPNNNVKNENNVENEDNVENVSSSSCPNTTFNLENVRKYFDSRGFVERYADNFYYYYKSLDWLNKNGVDIRPTWRNFAEQWFCYNENEDCKKEEEMDDYEKQEAHIKKLREEARRWG
jgi:hypothetical protein